MALAKSAPEHVLQLRVLGPGRDIEANLPGPPDATSEQRSLCQVGERGGHQRPKAASTLRGNTCALRSRVQRISCDMPQPQPLSRCFRSSRCTCADAHFVTTSGQRERVSGTAAALAQKRPVRRPPSKLLSSFSCSHCYSISTLVRSLTPSFASVHCTS